MYSDGIWRVAVPAVLLVAGVACAGCDVSAVRAAEDPSPVATPTKATTGSADPTPTPQPTTPSPTPTPTPTATPAAAPTDAVGLAAWLLPATAIPVPPTRSGQQGRWTWSEQATMAQSAPTGACAQLPLDALGAVAVARRTFVPTGDEGTGTATHEVARFVDQISVDRAVSVLRSWRDDCAQRVTGQGVAATTGEIGEVAAGKGSSWWYPTAVPSSEEGSDQQTRDAVGVLVSGLTIEILDLSVQVPAAAADQDPRAEQQQAMTTGLQAAAALLPE